MNFILKGVAKEVFSKINAMSEASINGGNIFYEGCRHGQDPGNIAIIRIEIKPADIGGMPARQVDARPFDPHHSQVLYNHSPDGFEWGYCGSGRPSSPWRCCSTPPDTRFSPSNIISSSRKSSSPAGG